MRGNKKKKTPKKMVQDYDAMGFLCVLWAYQTNKPLYIDIYVCAIERRMYVFRTIFFFYMFLTRLSSVFVIFSEHIITEALESYSIHTKKSRSFYCAHCLRFFFFSWSLPFDFISSEKKKPAF